MITALISSWLMIGAIENVNKTYPNLTGATGTLRTFSAKANEPKFFALGLMGSFASADPFINSRKHSRSFLRVHGDYTFDTKLPFEVFAGASFSFNESSTTTSSNTMTTYFENTDLGVRFGVPVKKDLFYLGAYILGRFFSGSQSLRNSSGGSAAKSGPIMAVEAAFLATADASTRWASFPLRYHLNIGYRSPNSDLRGPNDDFNIYSMDAYKHQALIASTSFEVVYKYVKPFIEYTTEYFLSSDVKFADNRKKMSLGARFTPLQVVSVLAAADIGLGGPGNNSSASIPRNPPWEIWFAVTFAADGKTLTKSFGSLKGVTFDEESGLPMEGVQVAVASSSIEPQLTDLSGFYEMSRLPNGDYELMFSKAGYNNETRRVSLREGRDALLDIRLKKSGPAYGGLVGQVLDKETQQPLARATVNIPGLENTLSTDVEGRFRINKIQEGNQTIRVEAPGYKLGEFNVQIKGRETYDEKLYLEKAPPETGTCEGVIKNPDGTPLTAVFTSEDGSVAPFGTNPLTGEYKVTLPAGSHKFKVQAENYLPQMIDCEVRAGEKSENNLTLEKPKEAMVIENKIVLPDAIFFEFGSAKIKEQSLGTLDQVAKILVDTKGIEVLYVDGHTDNVGSQEFNQKLSQKRAQSVKTYLAKKGVKASIIKPRGFGKERPAATNKTAEGRAENRRVEFNLNKDDEMDLPPLTP